MASRMIQVRKRDGRRETFNVNKLAASIWRGLCPAGGVYNDALELARAVHIFLQRKQRTSIASRAIFEMALKALRRIRMGEAAEIIELHRTLRSVRRRMLTICHETGQVTHWDKTWLVDLIGRIWNLRPTTCRILAGEIELDILPCQEKLLDRDELVNIINHKVASFGLADALPVQLYQPLNDSTQPLPEF